MIWIWPRRFNAHFCLSQINSRRRDGHELNLTLNARVASCSKIGLAQSYRQQSAKQSLHIYAYHQELKEAQRAYLNTHAEFETYDLIAYMANHLLMDLIGLSP